MSIAPETVSLMHRLREETRPQHEQAEHRRLERDMFAGKLPRSVYIALLGQRYLVHQTLESLLTSWARGDAQRETLVRPEWFPSPFAREDLAFFGIDIRTLEALPATKEMQRDLAAAADWSLLGYHYVFEGSKNGAKFVSRSVCRAYQLEPNGPGTRYLDPHGSEQQAVWQEFKQAMDRLTLTSSQADQVVDGAGAAFHAIGAIDDAVYPEAR